MSRIFRAAILLVILLTGLLMLFPRPKVSHAADPPSPPLIIGQVLNQQKQPVQVAQVQLLAPGGKKPLSAAQTHPDGSYILSVPKTLPSDAYIQISRSHYKTERMNLNAQQIKQIGSGETVVLPDVTLPLQIGEAFWAAAAIFTLMLVLIAAGNLHNTLAALLSAVLMFGVSYLGKLISLDLFIFSFGKAVSYVDWNVIFLIMGMMIVIAVVEETGIFQWLAFFAYRVSGGRMWLLMVVLMLIAGVAAAFLDNVTTMLLMAPITIRIAIALEMNPLALLMPEVMASNIIGISTLIGTPTNILIGSYAGLTFNDFLANQTPGVLLAFLALILYSFLIYRKELNAAIDVSPDLYAELEEGAQIKQPEHLKKAAWVGAGMLILFVTGESFNLQPAVTALLGATALLIWIRPDVEETIEAVDWPTLIFFVSLFIVVGGVQEVGLISLIANFSAKLVGQNLLLAMVVITWFSAIFSTTVANIPFTAAMLPVVGFLSGNIPAASNKVLFYCLSVGSAMGGNGSLIASSANMVTAGISKRAGYKISYMYFLKKGFPVLIFTVGLAFLWLLLRF